MENLGGFRSTNHQILNLLEKKRHDPHFSHHTVKDIDGIRSLVPWDLPRESDMEPEEQVWYFFYEPYYKYKASKRVDRRTEEGYWKVTGTGSNIRASNGLAGSKKILTFHRDCPDSKKAKTNWVMHEYHVEDKPSYKKEFVLCRIERKWDKKPGISTPDEGEPSQQMVSPTQILPDDHLISSGNQIDENTVKNPQPPPNHNSISYPGNHIDQNTQTNLQLPPNHNLISLYGNLIEQNSLPNQKLLPDQNMISYLGNLIQLLLTHNMVPYSGDHIAENALTNTQLQLIHNLISYYQLNMLPSLQLQPNPYLISCFGNHNEQNTNPQLLPCQNSISHPGNENTLSNPPLSSNRNPISFPRNHIDEDNAFTESQLPPNLESEVVTNQHLDKDIVVGNTLQEENRQLGEFSAGVSYNRLNYASFSAPQSPNFKDMEFSYCNSSIDSEQQRAFQDENSPEETGQTHTPDFKSSKSDGGTYAEVDSSDTNTEISDAWIDEQLLETIT